MNNVGDIYGDIEKIVGENTTSYTRATDYYGAPHVVRVLHNQNEFGDLCFELYEYVKKKTKESYENGREAVKWEY